MSQRDPVAELLTSLRNGSMARHRFVDVRFSKLRKDIVDVLLEQGYVEHLLVDTEKGNMRIFLKYSAGREPVLQGLKRLSSPGLRRYVGNEKIPRVRGNLGTVILSTSAGIMDGEKARKQKIGGELLCAVW